MPVELDTAALERAGRSLAAGIERNALDAAADSAEHTAGKLRGILPVRSGRLKGSVKVLRGSKDAAVSYGSGVPYAGYIDRRTDATDRAVEGADDDFRRRCETVADREARKV